jgi:signal transduction histidine kinase
LAERLDSELLGHLLALVAHDLRNPLSALHSNVGYLAGLEQCEDEETREALDDASLSCECLVVIIDNIDIVARQLIGKNTVPLLRFTVGSVIAEALSRCERIAASHRCQFAFSQVEAALSVQVKSNRDFLTRALINLLLNSVQHAGGSTIEVELSVGAKGEAVISITDSGSPLGPEERERAFFASGQLSAKTNGCGRYSRGLGLYVAKLAAEAAGAKVVAATHGQKNRFTVSFPPEGA